MPTLTLLTQKLFVPTLPAKRVVRPSLLQRLDAGLAAGRGVTLISAPAGYGKSTLAAEWVIHTRRPVTWLSLDESDDAPLHFFTYLVAALQRVDPKIGAELQTALAAEQVPPSPVLMAGLVNDLAGLDTPCLCVLDDFQYIQDDTILSVLQGILAHQPDTVHLVLVTREDPALPLARLRAGNQLTEIRAADLRFDEAEIQRFLGEGMGISLSRADLSELAERTEGWIAIQPPSPVARPAQISLVEPMSERGLEVLGLLAQGLKYGEIADKLVVSLNTVRFHVKAIYGKLGVNRQAHAVQRAQEIGLL